MSAKRAMLRTVKSATAKSLATYFAEVRKLRRAWRLPKHKELWFRAEDAIHRKTRLQPGLYRPPEGRTRKSIKKLLEIDNRLFEEFERCAAQFSDAKPQDDWEQYFLMQHHGVPTRLLDWTDGALVALHFAVRDKPSRPTSGSVVHVLDPYWLLDLLEKHRDNEEIELEVEQVPQ